MAVTWVGFGLVVGIPLGLVLGRAVWGRVAGGLYVATDLTVPWSMLALLQPAGLAVAALLAAGPAWRVSRARLGTLLRAA